jgi:hypothetical protein
MNEIQNAEDFVVMQNDILFGRGRSRDNHPGNKAFRDTVSKYKLPYLLETKTHQEKRNFVELVISEIKIQDPPGRFLCYDRSNNSWYEEEDVGKIRKKIAQALREDASSTRRLLRRSSIKSTAESDPPRHERSSKEGKTTTTKKKSIQDNEDDHILTQDEDNKEKVEVKSHCRVSMSTIEDNPDELISGEEEYDLKSSVHLSPVSSFLVSTADAEREEIVSPSDESSSAVKKKKARRPKWSKFSKLTFPHLVDSPLSTAVLSNSSVVDDDDIDIPSDKPVVKNKKRKSTQLKSTIARKDKALKVVPNDSSPLNLTPVLVEKEVNSEKEEVVNPQEHEVFQPFASNCWWEEEMTSHGYDWSGASRNEGG